MTSFKDLPFKQKIKFILAIWGAVSSFFLVLTVILMHLYIGTYNLTVDDGTGTLINTLVTLYVSGSIINVYTFYFGDSDATEPETN